MITLRALLLVLAFMCFVASALGLATRVNLTAAGLALLCAAFLLPA